MMKYAARQSYLASPLTLTISICMLIGLAGCSRNHLPAPYIIKNNNAATLSSSPYFNSYTPTYTRDQSPVVRYAQVKGQYYQTRNLHRFNHIVDMGHHAQSFAKPTLRKASSHTFFNTQTISQPFSNELSIQHSHPCDIYVNDLQVQNMCIMGQRPMGYTQIRALEAEQSSFHNALVSAYKLSPRIAAEQFRVQETGEVYEQAKAEGRLRSELRGVFGATQSDTVYSFIDRRDQDFNLRRSVTLDMSLPLYRGGLGRARKQSALASITSSEENLSTVIGQTLQATATAYIDVLRDTKIVRIFEQNIALLEEQKRSIKTLLAHQESTIADLALLDARLASVKIELTNAKAVYFESKMAYKSYVGVQPQALMSPPQLYRAPSILEAKKIARSRNPQLLAAIAQSESAAHDVSIAKAASRPTLSLQGILRASQGQSQTIDRSAAAELLLNLNIPLSSGGQNKSRKRQSIFAKARAQLEVQETYIRLDQNVESLWIYQQAALEAKTLNHAQVAASHIAFKSIATQRQAGLTTTLDVLSIEQTLLTAQLNLVRAEHLEYASNIQLLNLLGMFTPEALGLTNQ